MIFFLHSTSGIYIRHVVHRLATLLVQAVGFFSLKQRSPNSHESCNFSLIQCSKFNLFQSCLLAT